MDSPSRMVQLKSGAVFMDWKQEGVALLLQSPNSRKLRAWAKLMALAPVLLETAVRNIRTDTIQPKHQIDLLQWKSELQALLKEMTA